MKGIYIAVNNISSDDTVHLKEAIAIVKIYLEDHSEKKFKKRMHRRILFLTLILESLKDDSNISDVKKIIEKIELKIKKMEEKSKI